MAGCHGTIFTEFEPQPVKSLSPSESQHDILGRGFKWGLCAAAQGSSYRGHRIGQQDLQLCSWAALITHTRPDGGWGVGGSMILGQSHGLVQTQPSLGSQSTADTIMRAYQAEGAPVSPPRVPALCHVAGWLWWLDEHRQIGMLPGYCLPAPPATYGLLKRGKTIRSGRPSA